MDGDGYWVQYFSAELEDGSLTLLLVEDFSGSLGIDVDTNDDGAFDSSPWSSIVDDVAVSDGAVNDRHYSSTVLISNYDGVVGQPGGASRLPNGADTDTLADWMRNDFDGEGLPGFTGTPVTKEAINTPGAENRGNLVAGFTSNSPVLLGELSTFSNTTTGSGPISYSWDFGDASAPDTSTNPNHTYAAAGIYTVTLTATNQYESIEYSDSFEVIARLVAGFTSNTPVLLGELSTFTNSTIGPGTITYSWDFGDGSDPVTDENPTHTYAAADTYTVTLTATNEYESDGYSESFVVIVRLVAGFTSNTPVLLGELSSFTNTTTGPGTITYSWDFGDGSDPVTDENPTHTYAAAGTYTVTLTATNEHESDEYSESFDVIVRLAAGFTSNSPVLVGELSTFTNTTSGPGTITYSWDFGDGSDPVTDENPSHTYAASGTYTVTLTATNQYESDEFSDSFDVLVHIVAGFTSNSPVGLGELSVFTNTTTGPGTLTYSWDFGDGSDPVTDANPTHVYSTGGTFTVTLTATNEYESDVFVGSHTVQYRIYIPLILK
jgi:PKD repeat protein